MAPIEAVLFWLTLILYALASGGSAYGIVFRNERFLARMTWVVAAGWLLHNGAIADRFRAQGHLPWSGDYENGLAGGWFIVLFTLVVGLRKPALRVLQVATVPLALLLMGFGAMRSPSLGPLDASLRTFWLYIHVYFAWLAFGAYSLAMGAGVVYLLKARDAGRPERNPVYDRFPSLERLDELMFRYVIFGFVTDAIMIAAGSVWARDLWGSYWSWDPVETWSLISWLIYGLALHLRITRGWRGPRLAWLVVLAIVGVIISFFGVTFVVESSIHAFDVR